MTTSNEKKNSCVILQSRPGASGVASEENFAYIPCDYPTLTDSDKQSVVVETMYISVDPALRCRMNECTGVDYTKPWPLDGLGKQYGGCSRVIGICSSGSKCDVLVKECDYDEAIPYKECDVGRRLAHILGEKQHVDVYFDNVGGSISDAVIRHMSPGGHIILCGQISQYNSDLPYPPPLPADTQSLIDDRGITRKRFLVFDYIDQFEEALSELAQLASSNKLKVKETVISGLHNAGNAFVMMMSGGNIGKQLVKVSD